MYHLAHIYEDKKTYRSKYFSKSITYDRIYNTPSPLPTQLYFLEILIQDAQLLEQKKQWHKALSSYQQAVILIHQLRKDIHGVKQKELLVTETHFIYEQAVALSLQLAQKYPHKTLLMNQLAFSIAEYSKASILLDKIIKKSENPSFLIQKIEQLTQFIQEASFEATVKQGNFFLAHLHDQLPQDTAVIFYWLTNKNLYTFSITKKEITITTIKRTKALSLKKRIANFNHQLKLPLLKPYLKEATILYQLLINPIEKTLRNICKLIIIPDGSLYTVAFAALISENKLLKTNHLNKKISYNSFIDLPYLVKDYEISYQYSCTLLAQYWNTNTATLPQQKQNFLAFAPRFFNLKEVSNLTTSPHFTKKIVQLIKQKGFHATSFISKIATKSNFKKNLKKYAFIFLSTHGISKAYDKQSRIYFSQEKSEQNYLSYQEIEQLKIHADLLVLCCCESGLGNYKKGQGMMGLHQSFILAGCKNVVYTLSKIEEKNTGHLMLKFFEFLLQSEDKSYATALRHAQLQLIEQGKYPFFWAGFAITKGI